MIIGDIVPREVIGHMAMTNIEFIKHKALEYADLCIAGDDMPEAYKRDYNSGHYTDKQACAVVWLADVYIALKQGLYTRAEALEKQKEILRNAFPPQSDNPTFPTP